MMNAFLNSEVPVKVINNPSYSKREIYNNQNNFENKIINFKDILKSQTLDKQEININKNTSLSNDELKLEIINIENTLQKISDDNGIFPKEVLEDLINQIKSFLLILQKIEKSNFKLDKNLISTINEASFNINLIIAEMYKLLNAIKNNDITFDFNSSIDFIKSEIKNIDTIINEDLSKFTNKINELTRKTLNDFNREKVIVIDERGNKVLLNNNQKISTNNSIIIEDSKTIKIETVNNISESINKNNENVNNINTKIELNSNNEGKTIDSIENNIIELKIEGNENTEMKTFEIKKSGEIKEVIKDNNNPNLINIKNIEDVKIGNNINNKIENHQNSNIQKLYTKGDIEQLMSNVAGRTIIVMKEGKSELRMNLTPPELGKMSFRFTVEDGIMTGKIVVSTQEAKMIFEDKLSELQKYLQNSGVNLANVDISYSESGSGSEENTSKSLISQYYSNEIDMIEEDFSKEFSGYESYSINYIV